MSATRTAPRVRRACSPARSACRPTPAQDNLLATLAALNADPDVDAILVQLPLPAHISPRAVLDAIDPAKDADGFAPMNVGRLQDGTALLAPCTPTGVMKLLAHAGVSLNGCRALVLGRSAIVGKPVAVPAARRQRHSHHRPFPHAGPAGRMPPRRGADRRGRPARAGARRLDRRWRGGDRCRHQPRRRMAAWSAIVPRPNARSARHSSRPCLGASVPMTIACLLENTVAAAEQRR